MARPTSWLRAIALAAAASLAAFASRAADAPAHDGASARAAAIATDARVWRLTPDAAPALLAPLVAVKPDKGTDEETTLSGAAAATGVAWTRVVFQAGRKPGQWGFLQMQIALAPTDADAPPSAAALAHDLARKLGKPKAPASGKAEHLNTWTSHGHSVAVREGTFASPIDESRQHVVLLELAVDQGEAD
jgi:hypothetical protein